MYYWNRIFVFPTALKFKCYMFYFNIYVQLGMVHYIWKNFFFRSIIPRLFHDWMLNILVSLQVKMYFRWWGWAIVKKNRFLLQFYVLQMRKTDIDVSNFLYRFKHSFLTFLFSMLYLECILNLNGYYLKTFWNAAF